MDDLGGRISYLVLTAGVPVFSADGEKVGSVVRAMGVPEKDVFDGIVFETGAGHHGRRFVDGPEVGEIYERGVILRISSAEVAQLPKPGENPAALSVGPDDLVKSPQGRLRRAWGALTGKR